MATHSSILAWETPRTEEHGKLQSMGSQKSQDLATRQQQQQNVFVSNPLFFIAPRQITDGASKTLRRSY